MVAGRRFVGTLLVAEEARGLRANVAVGDSSIGGHVDECFFFSSRRRHTRWYCDWSSDVCSSELSLILRAYGLVDSQLIGAPSWLNTEHYNIDARTTAPADGPESLMPMVRGLLVERFRLKAHKIGRASCRERVWMSEGDGQLKKRR